MGLVLNGATGWILFVGLVLMTGAVVARWFIVPTASASADEAREMRGGMARLGTVGSAVLVLGIGLFFLRQLVEFRDPAFPWGEEAALLLSTPWGRTWLKAAFASLAATVSFAFAPRGGSWWMATGLTLALGAFPALTGHASAVERFTGLFVLADATHVWAAGAWIGGLTAVLWLDRTARRSDAGANALSRLVPPFSRIAMIAVASLIATGVLASWEHLPEPKALLTTTWGNLLVAKLVLVAGVLAIGAYNFRVLTDRLGSPDGDAAMRRSAALELAVAQLVLILTALLVRTSPTGH